MRRPGSPNLSLGNKPCKNRYNPIVKRDNMENNYIIDKKGRKTAVIISVEEYEELMGDIHDLAVVAERQEESNMTFSELKNKLREDGLL